MTFQYFYELKACKSNLEFCTSMGLIMGAQCSLIVLFEVFWCVVLVWCRFFPHFSAMIYKMAYLLLKAPHGLA